MIYRDQSRVAPSRELAKRLRDGFAAAAGGGDALTELLIDFGELEAGVADALNPLADGCGHETRVFRRVAIQVGRMFCGGGRSTADFGRGLSAIDALSLPGEIRVSVPEGYAFYGLDPQMYVSAARTFARERRPKDAAVVGIRSIGTSLSAVVAGALAESSVEVCSQTVRPRGHPFDRRLELRDDMRAAFRRMAKSQYVLVVDEGPGMSGSSFLAVARALRDCGVAPERIVLFPSWEADGSHMVNERARAAWRLYPKYCGAFEPPLAPGTFRDLSAGAWREIVDPQPGAMLISQPQHECRKYLADGLLYKFAGFGRYGAEKLAHAEALGEAGFSPPARRLSHGFLAFDFVPGRPMSRGGTSPEFLRRVADYLAFRARHFGTSERSVEFDEMVRMAEHNAGRMLPFLYSFEREFGSRPAVFPDARMMPHEWIETANGWLKTDAVDHGRDHFYPGQADPAWDLAGIMVEFQLRADEREFLVRQYRRRSRDRIPPGLLRFYEVVYLAFRAGYSAMAAEATSGTPDRDRFGALRLAYACFLHERLPINHETKVTA